MTIPRTADDLTPEWCSNALGRNIKATYDACRWFCLIHESRSSTMDFNLASDSSHCSDTRSR